MSLHSRQAASADRSGRPIEEISEDDWHALFKANVDGAFWLAQAAAPIMKKAGFGRIVTISSGAGLRPSLTGIQAYAAAKHALVGLTKQLSCELGPHGVTVNSVAPGFVLSNPTTQRQWESYGAGGSEAAASTAIHTKRLGKPTDIASAVRLLRERAGGLDFGPDSLGRWRPLVSDRVLDRLAGDRAAILQRLFDFVRHPSVGADPAFANGMRGAQDFLVERLRALGFRKVAAFEAGGQPAVYGEWRDAPGRPTFLVYGHYDVQPPDPLEKWVTPPFEPTIRGERVYGRGVSDDKAPSMIALEALGAFLREEGRLPVNVKVLMEGEEETGSTTLAALCRQHAALLAADAVISADGARWRADLPTSRSRPAAMPDSSSRSRRRRRISIRGAMAGRSQCAARDRRSRRLVPRRPRAGSRSRGFRTALPPLAEGERAALRAIPFDEDAFYAQLDSPPAGEPGYTTLERLWLRPTLEVNGLWGGYTGAGSKTVIPNEAHAKITMRLVPGQEPRRAEEAVKDHLVRHCPPGARISFGESRGGSGAYLLPADHPLLAAVEAALAKTLGAVPIRVRMGATLPVTDIIKRELGIDTVMFSFSTSDEDYHAPNEFFRLSSLDEGLSGWVTLLRVLDAQDPALYASFGSRS